MQIGRSFIRFLSSNPNQYIPKTKQTIRATPITVGHRISPRIMKLDSDEFHSLFTPQLNKLAEIFKKENYELRIAGGAVRDLLMGILPSDVDFASTATPQQMKDLFEKEEIRMLHKRGEEHGTITCRIDEKENFEITTLRVDVVCDGRRAEVQYTTDWQLDANRRDLTINSLFLDLDGTVIDYFGGIEDVEKKRVKFVGEPRQRIQEDYLRILRYFRFFGRIAAENTHEKDTLEAIKENKEGLEGISAERVWTEMKKIVIGRMAPEVVKCMLSECKLNKYLGLPDEVNLERFEKVHERFAGQLEPMTMVASLCNRKEDIEAFHRKTKLSNAERLLGEFIVSEREDGEKARDGRNEKYWKELIVGNEPGHDPSKSGSLSRVIQLAQSVGMDNSSIDQLTQWTIPQFPIKGTHLMSAGVPNGPKMRNTLQYLFDLWKKSEYTMDYSSLLEHSKDSEIPEPINTRGPGKRKRQESK